MATNDLCNLLRSLITFPLKLKFDPYSFKELSFFQLILIWFHTLQVSCPWKCVLAKKSDHEFIYEIRFVGFITIRKSQYIHIFITKKVIISKKQNKIIARE